MDDRRRQCVGEGGTVLSRYNRDDLCSACAAERRWRSTPESCGPAVVDCLAVFRHGVGMSRRELADASGVELGVIRRLEEGEIRAARLHTVAALAGPLRLQVAELLDPRTSPGSLLRRARERQGLTQLMLAANAGISPSYLSSLEKGARSLNHLPTVDVLVAALGIAPVELMPWLAGPDVESGPGG